VLRRFRGTALKMDVSGSTWSAGTDAARRSEGSLQLPPVANLFPGVLEAIDKDFNAIHLDPDESIGLGLTMALCGNLITTLGLNVQRYAHTKAEPGAAYTDSRLWWVGVSLMVLGEAGNFMAYGFAPATLVAPMGAVSVVANAAIASLLLAEEFRRRDLSGSLLIIIGGIGLVYFSPHEEKQLNSATLMAYIFSDIFFMYSGVLMLMLVLFLSMHKRWAREWVVVDLSLCAILGSWTVMCTKGLSVSVRMTMLGEENAFASWITYALLVVMLLTAMYQVKYLNQAMAHFGTSQVVPVYYVLFTLASVLGGIIMYREFTTMLASQIVAFFGSICITFIGVYLVTSDRNASAEEQVPSLPPCPPLSPSPSNAHANIHLRAGAVDGEHMRTHPQRAPFPHIPPVPPSLPSSLARRSECVMNWRR
jgi:drug/metabolite transporter (DMT)-like permease